MFNNTVHLKADGSTGSAVFDLALVDGPTNRKTLRSWVASDAKFDFTIGHQASNENPGYDTTRSVVRFARTSVEPETGKPVTVYAQLIMSHPDSSTVQQADLVLLLAGVISFLQNGGDSAAAQTVDNVADISATVARLWAQEP
jgi:hypothetical protein